jgi:hypothetical protein
MAEPTVEDKYFQHQLVITGRAIDRAQIVADYRADAEAAARKAEREKVLAELGKVWPQVQKEHSANWMNETEFDARVIELYQEAIDRMRKGQP